MLTISSKKVHTHTCVLVQTIGIKSFGVSELLTKYTKVTFHNKVVYMTAVIRMVITSRTNLPKKHNRCIARTVNTDIEHHHFSPEEIRLMIIFWSCCNGRGQSLIMAGITHISRAFFCRCSPSSTSLRVRELSSNVRPITY
jgi:hypothetical protein